MKNSTDTGSSRRTQTRTRKGAGAVSRKNAKRARGSAVSPSHPERADKRVREMEARIATQITHSPFSASDVHDLQQAAMEYIIAFKNGVGARPLDRHKAAKRAALSGLKGTPYEFADRQFQAAFNATQHIRC